MSRSTFALILLSLVFAACSEPQSPTEAVTSTLRQGDATALTEMPTTSVQTTSVPTVVVSPAEAVAALCTTLNESGLDTRTAALADFPTVYAEAGGTGDGRQMAVATCGEAIERVDAANEIIERNDFSKIDPATGEQVGPPFAVDDFGCEVDGFYGTVTNTGSWPLGITVYSVFKNGADKEIRTSDVREVIWSLAPGETVRAEGPHTEIRGAFVTCAVNFTLFDADPTDADGSLGDTQNTQLTGDDPATWLPALLALTEDTLGAAVPDVMGEAYDVRSGLFTGRGREFLTTQLPRPIGPITICATGLAQPDPDRLILVWEEDRPEHVAQGENGPETIAAEVVLHHGAFRRGSDRQWRWLASERQLQAATGEGCASVGLEPAG